jgi:class 3 adenylate cyclase
MPSVPARATVVLHKEGAYWRIVQWHFSMPVANEDALGVGLTANVEEILTIVQGEKPPVGAMGTDGSVTIMFSDIEGSTALMETLGEESWLELLDWHEGVVQRQTALFGGSVVKGQGDGFMLAFPAAGSAAACAVAIQRALDSGWEGVQVPARIGIHSGNAKVEAGDLFGRTVVIAARVASAADGREILVSQTVQEGLAGALAPGRRAVALLERSHQSPRGVSSAQAEPKWPVIRNGRPLSRTTMSPAKSREIFRADLPELPDSVEKFIGGARRYGFGRPFIIGRPSLYLHMQGPSLVRLTNSVWFSMLS